MVSPILTTGHLADIGIDPRDVTDSQLVHVVGVSASNVVRDLRENIANLLGGKMRHYEALLQKTHDDARARLVDRLQSDGWDGAYGVRYSHPNVVQGGCEVVIYATAFKLRPP